MTTTPEEPTQPEIVPAGDPAPRPGGPGEDPQSPSDPEIMPAADPT